MLCTMVKMLRERPQHGLQRVGVFFVPAPLLIILHELNHRILGAIP